MTLLYYDELFLQHIPVTAHPERKERLLRSWGRLCEKGLQNRCERGAPQSLAREAVLRVHSEAQVAAAEAACKANGGFLDVDTPVSARSVDAALLAAGSAVDAVDRVLDSESANALCLLRPPGHHATPTRSMGFCIFNSIALAASHAVENRGVSRVLVVDWDVHHGNGTQDIFYDDPRVMFFSAHRYPFYPGTGAANETGAGDGLGYTMNMPVAYGTAPAEYRKRFAAMLEEAASRIKPELVLLSAGFDAHALDPIGSLDLDFDDFTALGRMVLDVAAAHASGRLVSLLEGGYEVDTLAHCVEDHLRQLLGE